MATDPKLATQPSQPAPPGADAPPAPVADLAHDRDAQMLAAVQAEIAKEDAAGGGAPAPAPEPPKAAPAGNGAAKPGPQPGARVSVPKQHFDGLLTAAQKLRAENAELKGRLDERREIQAQQPAPPPEEPQPDHVKQLRERLDAINQERIDTEQAYEDNRLTGPQRMQKLIELERDAEEIRNAVIMTGVALAITAGVQRGPDRNALDAQALVQERKLQQARQLHNDHPYLAALNLDQLNWLADYARREAAAQGQTYGEGVAEDMRIQAHVAYLSDRFGPALAPTFRPPASGQPTQLSPQAQARAEKLDIQARQPPDVTNLGRAAPGRAGATEDQFMNIPFHELEKQTLQGLPKF